MLSCEVSVYPMETVDSDAIINRSLEAMKQTGVKYEIGNQSTYLYSENPDEIWQGIKAIYGAIQKADTEFSMVINLSNNT